MPIFATNTGTFSPLSVKGIHGAGSAVGDFLIQNSLRFDKDSPSTLTRSITTTGSQTKFTLSCWIKPSHDYDYTYLIGVSSSFSFYFTNTRKLHAEMYSPDGSTWAVISDTQATFPDVAAWYHVVATVDTSAGTTNADRFKIWVNGVQQTIDFTTYWAGLIDGNIKHLNESGQTHQINSRPGATYYSSFYLAEYHYLDGISVTSPTDFGEFDATTGIWTPKAYTGTYSNGIFYSNYGVSINADPTLRLWSHAFDGSDGSYVTGDGNTNNQSLWTYPDGIAVNTSLRLRLSGGTNSFVYVNGSQVAGVTDTGVGSPTWYTVTGVSNLTSIGVGNNGSTWSALHQIEVDGTVLTDATVGRNSFHLNFSNSSDVGEDQVGPNDFTASGLSTTNTIDAISAEFDGSTNNQYLRVANNNPLASNDVFTIECHFYPHTTSVIGLFDGGSGQSSIIRNYSNNEIKKQGGSGVSFAGDYTQNAWNHIAAVYTGSSGTDTMTVYVNGVSSGSASGLNGFTAGSNFDIGTINEGGDGKFDGLIRNFRVTRSVVYNAAFTPPSHTENLSPLAQTTLLALTTDAEGLTGDASTNNYSLTNSGSVAKVVQSTFGTTDIMKDSPTSGDTSADTGLGGQLVSNYCTYNPLDMGTVTLKNGNLEINTASTDHCVRGTIAIPESVKIYYEFTVTQRGGGGAQSPIVGVALPSLTLTQNPDSQTSNHWSYTGSGQKLGGGATYTNYGTGLSAGDVIGVAIDRSSGRIWFSHNGTWQNSGDPTDSTDTNAAFTNVPTTGTLHVFFGNNNSTPGLGLLNTGQSAFSNAAPTGYKCLCVTNLDSSDVPNGSDYFDINLYEGNGTTQSIPLNFAPDLLWIKETDGAKFHALCDTVRGDGKLIYTNSQLGEQDIGASVVDLTANGFDLGFNSGYTLVSHNHNTINHVAWAWKSGDSNTSVSAGSLNSSAYNQSQNWAALGTGDGAGSPYDWEQTFDGDDSTYGAIAPQNSALNLDLSGLPGGGLSYSQSVVITYNRNSSAPDVTVNGSAIGATADGTDRTHTITGSGLLTSVGGETRTAAGSGDMGIKKIVVDGRELVDSGVTPSVNVPSIASTTRANQTSGFSIVTWTAAAPGTSTLSHGLSSAPEFVMSYSRTTQNHWAIFHKDMGQSYVGRFNALAPLNVANYWGSSSDWNSNTFSVNASTAADNNIGDMVAYCWNSVEGYSAFGSWSTDTAPFIYTGFSPRFLLYRYSTHDGNWAIFDTKRQQGNPVDKYLYANEPDIEATAANFDFLSNGFKVKASLPVGRTVVYACFAEHPFKYNNRAL